MTVLAENLEARTSRYTFEGFREAIVALVFISSFFVKIEPALTDVLGVAVIFLYARSGLRFSRALAAPLLLLILYLVSGIVSAIPIDLPSHFEGGHTAPQYALVLAYTSLTGIFLAAYIAANPIDRYLAVEKAYWIGATLGALLALLAYFRVEPVLSLLRATGEESFGDYVWRATGGFKDPNVFSTWLVFPAVTMMQAFLVGRLKPNFISIFGFLLILAGLFFAFSRGAWIDTVAAGALTILFTAILSPSPSQRLRIVGVTIVGLVALGALFAVLLSMPDIHAAFFDRFTLVKEYDVGETGRFGNQLNAIPMLLTHPFGLGPYQFQEIFGIAPHNTFLNSFASGGWIGGFSYLTLFAANVMMGIKTIFSRSPYQQMAIPVFTTLIVMTLQGIQIDNEHWRHIYWMMGMGWGFFAANQDRQVEAFKRTDIQSGWPAQPTP